MFVWWGRGKFVPPNIHIFVKFSDFESAAKDNKDEHGPGRGEDFTCENNMLSSHVKISPLLWLHNKPHLSDQKTI